MNRFLPVFAFIWLIHAMAYTAAVAAQTTAPDNPDVASLKATHERMLKAWSDHDIQTIVEICNGAVGFGHSTAFPRPIRVEGPFRKGLAEFYSMMDVFTITLISAEYMVVDNTGVAWGHLMYTSKQKDGPQRMIYQRYVHTFAKRDEKWKQVSYHRSLIPTVDEQ
ncbi:MAG: YybH family protein [Candidatus Latescibacterota bacterium]